MEKIAAIVVTFNRYLLLKKVVAGLRLQTHKIDEIIIVNNSSSDETNQWLAEQNDLTVIVQDNLGSSGGQFAGAKYAFDKGYDLIWLMDDDVVADENCLSNLMKYKKDFDVVCPLRYNPDGVYINDIKRINMTNPFKSIWKEIISIEDTRKEIIEIEAFTFEGPLISRHVFEKIGMPEKAFFIYADDTEFSVRALFNKFTTAIVTSAVFHRQIPPIGDKAAFTWKNFYMIRNLIAIDKMHGSLGIKYFRPIGYLISWLKAAKNFSEAKTVFKAFIAGLRYKSQND
jgi:rhamnopyranosyl-N-acetylglucosaminyl-diphospho-decaprenol beta-1,3/1,4-galactofuranosyltransferase